METAGIIMHCRKIIELGTRNCHRKLDALSSPKGHPISALRSLIVVLKHFKKNHRNMMYLFQVPILQTISFLQYQIFMLDSPAQSHEFIL
jgi:hypothetical protein